MKDNSKCFGINDIDINKIRISEKSLYSKQHNAYKYYVLYEHNNEYMPLRITLKDLVGYYDVYNDDKRMKLDITLNDFTFEKKGENYFKIKVTDETCFKENINPTLILKEGKVITKESDANFIPKENVMYTCRSLLQIQSVFFETKDNNDDISYHLQLLLQECICKRFINKVIFHHLSLQILNQNWNQNLKKKLMKVLCLMSNFDNVLIIYQ